MRLNEISLNAARQLKDKLLVDVRLEYEYRMWHIDGFVNMPYPSILSDIAKYPKDTNIVLYCKYGVTSKRVGKLLTDLGYTNVYYLKETEKELLL